MQYEASDALGSMGGEGAGGRPTVGVFEGGSVVEEGLDGGEADDVETQVGGVAAPDADAQQRVFHVGAHQHFKLGQRVRQPALVVLEQHELVERVVPGQANGATNQSRTFEKYLPT